MFPIGGLTTLHGFWRWICSDEVNANALRRLDCFLFALVAMQAVFRYLREVANAKMSMNMVYYIREAVYDRLQRVGFGFHDVLSTGQLINRALTDLQNVRGFVQTAGADHTGNRAVRRRLHGHDFLYQPLVGADLADSVADLDLVHPALWQSGAACQ